MSYSNLAFLFVVVVTAAALTAAGPIAEPVTIDVVWTHELNAPARGSPGLVETADGPLVIVGTDDGDVVALDGAGRVRWRDHVGARAHGWPSVIDLPAGRTILIGDSEGGLHAYAPDGTARWHISLGRLAKADWGHSGISPWSGAAPLQGGGRAAIVVTDRSGRVTALTADGQMVWQAHLTERTHFPVVGAPAVGDLDGDGADEIVVSGFDGRAHCYGVDGSLRWVTNVLPAEGGYHSPLIIDTGEGPRVLLLGRTEGELRCLDGAGREVWRHQSRGAVGIHMGITPIRVDGAWRIFVANTKTGQDILDTRGGNTRTIWIGGGGGQLFGPSAADLDGDGKIELLMPRIHYPRLYILDADANERATFDIDGETWGAPLIADLDGDRVPEFVVLNARTGRVQALRVHGARPGGEIQWPTSRGAFDGRRSVLPATTTAHPSPRPKPGNARIVRAEPMALGTGRQLLRFSAPGAPADAWVWVELTRPDGVRHVFVNRLDDPDHGWIEPLDGGTYGIAARLQSADGVILGERAERIRFSPFTAERETGAALVRELDTVLAGAALSASRLAALRMGRDILAARMDDAGRHGTAEGRRALAAEILREHAALRAEIARRRFAAAERITEIAVWPTGHPWTPYDPRTDAPPEGAAQSVRVTTEQRAHEATSTAVANLTDATIFVRAWLDPWTGGEHPPAPDAVTLRRRVFVATARGTMTPDALPALDPSGVITIAAGETVRLWLDWDAGDTPHGTYASALHVRALTVAGEVLTVPLAWEVLPVALPDVSPLAFHVWAYENAMFFDVDAIWRDLIDHHVNVFDLPVAAARYDAEGRIVAEDWTATERILARAPAGSWFLWSASDGIVQPAEGAPPIGSSAWEQAFRAFVPRWINGLAARGVPLEHHTNYILDEPGVGGGPDVEEFIRVGRLYKAADPRVRIFANPAGGATREHIDRLSEVTDVFDPIWCWPQEYTHLERIIGFGKPTWTYECGDGAKDNTRMQYYWAPIWRGTEVGLTGFGIWSYAGRGIDFWQGPHDGCCDWELVYHGNGTVIPSHRWQGVRIGVEDYARLAMIRDTATRARTRGDADRADFLERRRTEIIRTVLASGLDEAVVARARAEMQAILIEEAGR